MNTVKEMRIETKRLIIRPYIEEDLEECFKLMQNKELFKYLDMDVMSYDGYKGLFQWLIDCYEVGFNEDFKYSFNITLKDTGTHIGWCGIGGVEFDHKKKEIYYLIGREYWGKGYAKEASSALLDYGFNVMGLKEIVGLCKPENIASKKVLENLGLIYRYMVQGLSEEFDFYNGEPYYSLTKEEYLQKKSLIHEK
ncbi:GNAT family N-acetyltransferase [Oceanirhabdus sp. W0125-5]|uniref:GNAT family N-acetyltransferase n=1 Tax=Oceanirhabdus sp. W0125-5 TaxID=2999116 RepID=UPI0022F2CE13|nr:GNAT family N-acetyltransferase [Oceanirhabdus sp. W0125-5]WBW96067.1 GNAT family N-acetyltransferase [Oceanirhabdus sp. W0125-5]